jgi:hypothetical protein
MPTISSFYGILIRMYLFDHAPPHFHARYGEYEARIAMTSGEIIDGHLPRNAARLVKEWTLARQRELADNWARAHASEPLKKIEGLE